MFFCLEWYTILSMNETLSEKKRRAQVVLRELKKLFPKPEIALRYTSDWELLVAVILSAQCTDKKVNEVTARLFRQYPSIQRYARASPAVFAEDIRQVGLYKTKAKHIIATAQILLRDHNGQIPKDLSELTKLPGVGRKTANVVLGALHGVAHGIAVDTHVARLSRKFELTTHHNPKKIEQDLMACVPQPEWIDFTHRLILYGRQYSPARKREDTTDPISHVLKSL